MNALPSRRIPLRSVPSRREAPAQRRSSRLTHRQKQRQSYQTIAFESGVKLAVNALLGVVAIATLVKLVPYNLAQHTKVQQLTAEVDRVENRVAQLQKELSYNFDPQQMRRIAGDQSGLQDPSQRPVQFSTPPNIAQDVE